MYFEDAETYFDKIVMLSHKEKQINTLKFLIYNCSQVGSYFSLHTAEIRTLHFVFNCLAEDLFKLISDKFRMVCEVDGTSSLIHVIGACTRESLNNFLKT